MALSHLLALLLDFDAEEQRGAAEHFQDPRS